MTDKQRVLAAVRDLPENASLEDAIERLCLLDKVRTGGDTVRAGKLNQRLVPALLVKDMVETLAFYRALGFALAGCHPDQQRATWAEVARDGVALQFHTEPSCGTPPAPICSGTFYFYPEDVEALAEELRGKVSFAWGPEVMEHGMREFGVQDPNGYYLAFTEPA